MLSSGVENLYTALLKEKCRVVDFETWYDTYGNRSWSIGIYDKENSYMIIILEYEDG